AFRWTSETGMVGVDFPEQPESWSADGSVIVGGKYAGYANYWTQATGSHDLRSVLALSYGLDMNDWNLTEASGVSADGRTIVGVGIHGFRTEAWIARLPAPADFNGDGSVDGGDLVTWTANAGRESGALNAQGDADFDGDVDGADFLIWQSNLG